MVASSPIFSPLLITRVALVLTSSLRMAGLQAWFARAKDGESAWPMLDPSGPFTGCQFNLTKSVGCVKH